MKRRIDVNLEELDQIIDPSTRAPLSESEGQKLKTATYAYGGAFVVEMDYGKNRFGNVRSIYG